MSAPVTGSASAHRGAIEVEVVAGGAMTGLRLTEQALRLGGPALAEALLGAVREATALADQRTRLALAGPMTGVDPAVLGLVRDPELIERVETTTPQTWRQQ